jgi:hypothetical protein
MNTYLNAKNYLSTFQTNQMIKYAFNIIISSLMHLQLNFYKHKNSIEVESYPRNVHISKYNNHWTSNEP